MSLAGRTVSVAAALLPKRLRPRYREQWTSDLRDADEAGISRREIATGALAFALTVGRPTPWSGVGAPTAAAVERRSRFAAALAISAAALGVAGFVTSRYSFSSSTGSDVADAVVEAANGWLLAFRLLAPVVAVVVISRTRAVDSRVRLAVWLLVLASLAPVAQLQADWALLTYDTRMLRPGNLAYLVAGIIVVFALRLLWRSLAHQRPARTPSVLTLVLSAVVVAAVGGLGLAHGAIAWTARVPLVFSWLPGKAGTMVDGRIVWQEMPVTWPMYLEWLEAERQYEYDVATSFLLVAVGTVALTVAVVLLAIGLRIRPQTLAASSIAILVLASAALASLMQFGTSQPIVSPDVLLILGQWLLVGVVVGATADLRLTRVRHRHDVEGAVELVEG